MSRKQADSTHRTSNRNSRKQSPLPTNNFTPNQHLSESSHLRKGIITKASEKLNRRAIQQKVIKADDHELQNEQESRIASIFAKEKTMIKIEYYDTLLNLERKCDHFTRLFQKIRLRVIHHPFIVLEMLKLMETRGSAHYFFSALYKKLESMRRRNSLDAIISFVERKREIDSTWSHFARAILAKSRRNFRKQIEAQRTKELRKQRHGRVVKRGIRYMATVFNNILRDRMNDSFSQIERKAGRGSYLRQQQEDGSRVREKTSELRIQGNQGFVIEKSAEKNRRQRNQNYPDYFKKNINQVMADVDVTGSKGRKSKAGSQREPEDSKERRNKKSRLFFEEEEEENVDQIEESQGKAVNIFNPLSNHDIKISTQKISQKKFNQHSGANKSGNTSVNHLSGQTGNFGTTASQRMDGALNRSNKLVIKKSSSKNLRKQNNSIPNLNKKSSQPSLRGSAQPPRLKSGEIPLKNQISRKRMTLNQEKTQILLTRIKNEIKELQNGIHREEAEGVPFQAHIELLGKLTTLLELVKKYYQNLKKSSFRGEESSHSKKNFEQTLMLIKKLMDKLLRKMTTDIATSQMLDKSQKGEYTEDEYERNRKHKSLIRIDSMRKRLTQDINTLIPNRFPVPLDTSIGSPHKTIDENEENSRTPIQLQRSSEIKDILAELSKKLNNDTKDFLNEMEAHHSNHNTSNTFGQNNSKLNSNNRYGTITQNDLRMEFCQTSKGRKWDKLHNPQNNDFGEDASGLLPDQSSGGDFIEQNNSLRRVRKKNPKYQYKQQLDESELQPRLKDQLIDACWNLKIKMQKKMKEKKLSGFNAIFDTAVNETELDKLRKIVSEVEKNDFLLTLAKMTVQVQNRFDLKQQVTQRLNWTWDLKRRVAFTAFRHAIRGNNFDYKLALQDEIQRSKYPGGRFFSPIITPQHPPINTPGYHNNFYQPQHPSANFPHPHPQYLKAGIQNSRAGPNSQFQNQGQYNPTQIPRNPNQPYGIQNPHIVPNGQFFQQSMHDQLSQRGQIINGSQYPVDENGFYIDINGLGNYPNEWMEQNQLPNEIYLPPGYQNPNNAVYAEQLNLQQAQNSLQSGQQGFIQVSQPTAEQYYHNNNPNNNQIHGLANQIPQPGFGPAMGNNTPQSGFGPGMGNQLPQTIPEARVGNQFGQGGPVMSNQMQQGGINVRQFSHFGQGNGPSNMNDDSLYLNLEEEYLHKVSLKQDKKGHFGGKK